MFKEIFMKRLFLFLLFTLQAGVLFAQGDNSISMVTYFPVPYVAYNRVKATKQMDIGLSAKPASLVLGTASTTAPLTVSGTTTVTGGALSLNFADSVTNKRLSVSATSGANAGIISLGTPNQSDMANLTFKNLTVGEIALPAGQFPAKNGVAVSSINTDELVVSGLKLFGSNFPDCSAVNPTNGNGQIAWKQLALGPNKNSKSVYLTCGGTQTCSLLNKPLDKKACQVNEWVSSLSIFGLKNLYESGVVSPSLSHYCAFFNMVCDYDAMRTNLQNKEGTDYLLCGSQTKNYECNLDTNPPIWQSDSSWDYSGCQTQKKQTKEFIASCQDYFANSNANLSFLNGWTLEGNVYEITNYTKDSNGSCSSQEPVISTGECVAAKYVWGNEELVSTGTQYVNPTSYYDQVVWSLQHPSSSGMYINGGHSACYHIRECNEGYSEASCSSSSDVGTTRQRVKGVSTGSSTKCQVWRHNYGTGSNGQVVDHPWHDSAADFNATVYSCNTYRETCKKRCHDVRLYKYDDGDQAMFVNSERDCN